MQENEQLEAKLGRDNDYETIVSPELEFNTDYHKRLHADIKENLVQKENLKMNNFSYKHNSYIEVLGVKSTNIPNKRQKQSNNMKATTATKNNNLELLLLIIGLNQQINFLTKMLVEVYSTTNENQLIQKKETILCNLQLEEY